MAYDATIQRVILAKMAGDKENSGSFYLPDCNQHDVMDTVNKMHESQPKVYSAEANENGLVKISYDISSTLPQDF